MISDRSRQELRQVLGDITKEGLRPLELVRYPRAMSALLGLDWKQVRAHYDDRVDVHERLLKLHDGGLLDPFAKLLLGISDRAGNYSAAEHGLGPKILVNNGAGVAKRIADLAASFRALTKPRDVPPLIRAAGLSYMAIGVGSEASCMVNPERCWIANTRSIWTHLVIKHADNIGKADEELKLYRNGDPSSEMAYAIWAEIHRLLETSMTRVAEEGARHATKNQVTPGEITFLWADAIASALYSLHH